MNPLKEESRHGHHQTVQPQCLLSSLQQYNKNPTYAVTSSDAQTCVKYVIDSPNEISCAICEERFICRWVHPSPLVL